MPTDQVTILILYANYGEGHKRAAQAIEETLRKQLPKAAIITEDFLGDAFPVSDWVMRKLYLQSFHWGKGIYGYLYYKTKQLPSDAGLFQMLSYLGYWKLEKYLMKHQPTLVISTFPTLTGMLAKIKEKGSIPFRLWCVVTDYTAHSQWIYQAVDHYFVPSADIKVELTQFGIDNSVISATGIPVLSSFYKKANRRNLLAKWGLDGERPILLISAGAFGVTNLAEVCSSILKASPNAQFVVVCGRNRHLYQQMKWIEHSNPGNLLALPFVKEMEELLHLADLFITKAGGLSVSEAMVAKVPMVLYKSLPGQEAENAKYLKKLGIAHCAKTTSELVQIVSELVSDRDQLLSMKSKIPTFHFESSTAAVMASTIQNYFFDKMPAYRTLPYKNQLLVTDGIPFN